MKSSSMELDPSLELLLFGHHPDHGLISLERIAEKDRPDEMLLFFREHGERHEKREVFTPFIWLVSSDLIDADINPLEIRHLEGRGAFRYLALFGSWKIFQDVVKKLKAKTGLNPSSSEAPYFFVNDPIQQHLLLTGRTSFKGMSFSSLKRMQVDIETYTTPDYDFCNAERDTDRIIAIALSDETGWVEVLSGSDMDEATLLEQFVSRVQERDPDVIEGHNIFKFDLPYIQTRAKKHGISLELGRDGSAPQKRSGRFSAAERAITYPKYEIFGRHVMDTLFMVQLYDVSSRSLESFGLKEVATHFGLAPANRTYLEGATIAREFDKNPDRVMEYARNDILETRALSDLLSPIYFVQAQLFPLSYQNILVRGNGVKIDSLLLREYLRQENAIPFPDEPKEFAGGYIDLFFSGITENVHHCDVRSLYPSLMLKNELAPSSDELGVFLHVLDYLRMFRLNAKEQMQSTTSDDQRRYWNAFQNTFKIIINSFYGYLGFQQGRFNDFEIAAEVATKGREVLKNMVAWIEKNEGRPIEIDTDGIYFVPPSLRTDAELSTYRQRFKEALPDGVEIEFDGIYKTMFSYKMKNYALLNDAGKMIIKGAALKSRGLEPFQRKFLREIVRLKLEGREGDISSLKNEYQAAIEQRTWPIQQLAKTETLQEAPSRYAEKIEGKSRGRNAAYELAIQSGRDYQAGDRISYYVMGQKKTVALYEYAKMISDWNPADRDENVAYYLAKLEALYKKFSVEDIKNLQKELSL
ncbi:MAG: DNA polymerase II [Kiritimatiellae bacterium]|nr:DNA polymerase II [Kiritimatiellia bacterium]